MQVRAGLRDGQLVHCGRRARRQLDERETAATDVRSQRAPSFTFMHFIHSIKTSITITNGSLWPSGGKKGQNILKSTLYKSWKCKSMVAG